MFFYEVVINSPAYQGKKVLTYHYSDQLAVGTVVKVTLKREPVIGFITKVVQKPTGFKTNPIEEAFDLPQLPVELVKLSLWLSEYYPAGIGNIGQQFLPRSLSPQLIKPSQPLDNRVPESTALALEPLTKEQRQVIAQIDHPDTYILHGETGSGKTRVYIELTQKTLQKGRSVLILTPEIALTPQLEYNFRTAFQDRVVVTHSGLTENERRRAWLRILRSSEPLIVIGPRSTLFSPLKNIGLIVVDESHEPSDKQERSPHYMANRVAAKLAKLNDAILLLGSATPSLVDYYMAIQREKPILRMMTPARSTEDQVTKVSVIDIRNRDNFIKNSHLSDELITTIEAALHAGEQSLLFLNRRGTAKLILCEQCSWQAVCSHCNLPLTYHGDTYTMRCHVCGRNLPVINACLSCHNPAILFKSIGTKAIYDEISTLFPGVNIQRFDTDNKKSERIEQHYSDVHAGKIDILVGTQILAKGLDLPKLSVVGVIAADTSLGFPDYTASERTYQLLRQVVGRVGRGHRDGRVIIQTYAPQNRVIQAAATNQWENFYEQELAERKQFLFPPYCHLLKLTCRLVDNAKAEKKALKLVQSLQENNFRVKIEGPVPAPHEKINGKYEWHIVLKAAQRSELLKVIASLPTGWSFDIDPVNLL